MRVERSADFRGDAEMGEVSVTGARFPSGWPKGPVGVGCNAVQPRRASGRHGLAEGPGRRRSELVKLTEFDVDTRGGTVFVHQGKGRKDRLVPIGERALMWLARYREEVRAGWCIDPQQTVLFLNPDGIVPSVDALTNRARRLLQHAGVTKPGACHLFRHTMATEMLDRGADLRYVQEMLGHASIGTTQIYTHVSIAKLKAVHAATHPGAKLGRKTEDDGGAT